MTQMMFLGDKSVFAHYLSLAIYRESYYYDFFFLEDYDKGTNYLSTKIELDLSSNNGDLLSDGSTARQTNRQTDTHTHTKSDTLPI